MYIRLVDNIHDFAALDRQWDELLGKSAQPDIFLTHEWLYTWWEFYHGKGRLCILLCYDHDGQLAGILPAYTRESRICPKAGVLKFLGSEHVTSDFLSCIAAAGKERLVYDAIFWHLQSDRKLWDVMELANVESGASFDRYIREWRLPGATVRVADAALKCPYIELPGDWETFIKSLSFKARKKIRYFRNALAKKGSVELHTVHDKGALDGALHEALGLYRATMNRKGWKEKFLSERYRNFYWKACERLLASGRLLLNFLRIDGRSVAFLNCFKYGNRTYAYHTGFDAAWYESSVGFVLLGSVIELAIRDNCARFELLRGDQRYKYEWSVTGERRMGDVTICSGTSPGRMYDFLGRSKRLLGSTLSALKGRT